MKRSIASSILLVSSFSVFAQGDLGIGVKLGIGESDYSSESNNIDAATNFSIYMHKQFNEQMLIQLEYQQGESHTLLENHEDGSTTPVEDKDEDMLFKALSINTQWLMPISDFSKLYFGAGLSYYDSEVSVHNSASLEQDGVGYNVNLGWRYQFSNNWSANLEWMLSDMDDVQLQSTNIGFAYQF